MPSPPATTTIRTTTYLQNLPREPPSVPIMTRAFPLAVGVERDHDRVGAGVRGRGESEREEEILRPVDLVGERGGHRPDLERSVDRYGAQVVGVPVPVDDLERIVERSADGEG